MSTYLNGRLKGVDFTSFSNCMGDLAGSFSQTLSNNLTLGQKSLRGQKEDFCPFPWRVACSLPALQIDNIIPLSVKSLGPSPEDKAQKHHNSVFSLDSIYVVQRHMVSQLTRHFLYIESRVHIDYDFINQTTNWTPWK